MAHSKTHAFPDDWGVSFSLKYAQEMGVDPKQCLESALKDLGFRHLRLMSYWDIHEPKPGHYDFTELDWQFALAKKYNAKVSLAIGLRQPRWPESHWPSWARELPEGEWHQALFNYLETILNRYKDHPALASWQLENEAMLKHFGEDGDFNRDRLRYEFALVKSLDEKHPVFMSLSDSWGLPWHAPWPDSFGISLYRHFFDRGKYRRSHRPPLFYRLRAGFVRAINGRRTFIHELQCEPWGPGATVHMSLKEQDKTMDVAKIKQAVEFAGKTKLMPAYLWGLEWWYWRKTVYNDKEMWQSIVEILADTRA